MPTWADLKERVISEMDLAEEDFVDQDSELLKYANRGINKAESLILNLNEDYFLTEPQTITLVSGQQAYDLADDIYAQKIRFIQYNNGAEDYQIKKVTNLGDIPRIIAGDRYKYVLTNHATNGLKLRLYPTPAEDGAYVSIWYLRSSEPLVDDTDEIDLPEAYDYISQFMKDCIDNKEKMQPNAPPSEALKFEEQLLVASLHQRTVDEPISTADDVAEYIEDKES